MIAGWISYLTEYGTFLANYDTGAQPVRAVVRMQVTVETASCDLRLDYSACHFVDSIRQWIVVADVEHRQCVVVHPSLFGFRNDPFLSQKDD
nr:hypothetical protein TR92_21120 [Brucella anthropi]